MVRTFNMSHLNVLIKV